MKKTRKNETECYIATYVKMQYETACRIYSHNSDT